MKGSDNLMDELNKIPTIFFPISKSSITFLDALQSRASLDTWDYNPQTRGCASRLSVSWTFSSDAVCCLNTASLIVLYSL